jgi:hypothetical protein
VTVPVNRVVIPLAITVMLLVINGCGDEADRGSSPGTGREMGVAPGAPRGAVAGEEEQRWVVYRNPRLGFQIEFPPTLLAPEDRLAGGEEIELSSEDEEVTLRVSGRRGAEEEAVLQRYASLIDEELRRITSREDLDDGAVVSGYDGTRVFHEMIRVREGIVATIELGYPESRSEVMSGVADRVIRSFAWTDAPAETAPSPMNP